MVDGIVYNYIVSNHHGDGTPNITSGFDRTFGPQYFHFNKGSPNTTLDQLRQDAAQYADPSWNAAFYDSIAPLVPGYVPTSGRGTFKAVVTLPTGTIANPIAVLAQNDVDFQDNAQSVTDYQYWADIDIDTGLVTIPRVKAGTYRLTIYADGVFGWYTEDDIVVDAGETASINVTWIPDSAGTELWRIGTPDKSAGEYKHGHAPDPSHPNHIEEYRVYWAVYDFPTDFPEGVNFRIGESKEAEDWNYIHWRFVKTIPSTSLNIEANKKYQCIRRLRKLPPPNPHHLIKNLQLDNILPPHRPLPPRERNSNPNNPTRRRKNSSRKHRYLQLHPTILKPPLNRHRKRARTRTMGNPLLP